LTNARVSRRNAGRPRKKIALPPLKLMGQSRRGVVLEVQVRPLMAVIPRFIQLEVPLPPLKPTAQLQRGVNPITFKSGKGAIS
jgi:hypothetical protein